MLRPSFFITSRLNHKNATIWFAQPSISRLINSSSSFSLLFLFGLISRIMIISSLSFWFCLLHHTHSWIISSAQKEPAASFFPYASSLLRCPFSSTFFSWHPRAASPSATCSSKKEGICLLKERAFLSSAFLPSPHQAYASSSSSSSSSSWLLSIFCCAGYFLALWFALPTLFSISSWT